jgi:hypothetical protein
MNKLRMANAVLSTGVAWLASGCGSSETHKMMLLTKAQWNDYPGSAADVGYWISVDFGWPDRTQECFPLPAALHVTVNGQPAQPVQVYGGDCLWDVVYQIGPISPDGAQTTMVRVLDGENQLGEASYSGLFPSFPAKLVSPADGTVHAGEGLTFALLGPLPAGIEISVNAKYFWLDTAGGIPPYYEWASATLAPDRQTITVQSPSSATQGRAAIVIPVFVQPMQVAQSCVGFTSCAGWQNDDIGPVFVEVVP